MKNKTDEKIKLTFKEFNLEITGKSVRWIIVLIVLGVLIIKYINDIISFFSI